MYKANTYETIIASNLYFTNYEASIISIHFTLPLHISVFDLRFHSSSTSMLWRKWSACSPQLTQDQRCWSRSLQVSDGRELVIFSVNYLVLPTILQNHRHFIPVVVSIRSQLVAPSLRLPASHTSELKLRNHTVNSQWYFITKNSSLKETNNLKHEAQKIDK